MMPLTIRGRAIDGDQPLFVVAELGLNHGGDVGRALRLIDAAAHAGVAAVKVQSFRADRLVAPHCPAPAHVASRSLRAFFRQFELDGPAHRVLAEYAHARGLALVATPFDEEKVDLLESVGCDAFKIASGDLTFLPLIRRVASTGRPVLLSTGMSDLDDVRIAVACAQDAGARELALLHCVSAYPVPRGHENLRGIAALGRAFGLPVGLSDHSTEPLAAPLAVALGASIYERHLALGAESEDAEVERAVSSTASEFCGVIETAERVRRALGNGRKECQSVELVNRVASRRSLHTTRDLHAGDTVAPECLAVLRPGTGIDPRRWSATIGRRVGRDVGGGQPLRDEDLVSDVGNQRGPLRAVA